VQNYLQGCRGDPIKALNEVNAWITEHKVVAENSSASHNINQNGVASAAIVKPVPDGSELDNPIPTGSMD
jgi:chaperone BCS1